MSEFSARFALRLPVLAVLVVLQLVSLLAFHRYPQTVFYNEFFAAVLVLMAGTLLVKQSFVLRVSALMIAFCLLMLVAGGWLVTGAGVTGSVGQVLYVSLLMTVTIVLQAAASALGRTRLVDGLAWGLLICAILQCVVAALQLSGWSASGWVMVKLMSAAYGNIAQENHFADLICLGVVSVFYLWLRKVFPASLAIFVGAMLAVFAALSVSRAVWLYIVAIPLVAVLYSRRMMLKERHRVWTGAALILILGVAAQLWLAQGGAQTALGVTSAIDRAGEAGSNGQRMFDWAVAWRTAWRHPFRGTGPGSFAWQTALASIGLEPVNYVRIGENAHNTALHFAAEFGWVFVLVVLMLIGAWLWRRWQEMPTLETLWALGILTVVGAHSMVEYPLWYVYFLVPFGSAIAVADAGDARLPAPRVNGRWLWIPLVVGALILACTWRDYRGLEEGYRMLNGPDGHLDPPVADQLDLIGAAVPRWSLLALHADALRVRAWRPDDVRRAAQIAEVCDRVVPGKPSYQVFTPCLAAYVAMGRKVEADRLNEIVCGAFAPVHSQVFVAYAQRLYAARKWQLPERGRCLK